MSVAGSGRTGANRAQTDRVCTGSEYAEQSRDKGSHHPMIPSPFSEPLRGQGWLRGWFTHLKSPLLKKDR